MQGCTVCTLDLAVCKSDEHVCAVTEIVYAATEMTPGMHARATETRPAVGL